VSRNVNENSHTDTHTHKPKRRIHSEIETCYPHTRNEKPKKERKGKVLNGKNFVSAFPFGLLFFEKKEARRRRRSQNIYK